MLSRDREFWVAAVAECERSELTQESFAMRRGLNLSTLRSWIYKLRRERKASVSLVPVRVITSTAPKARQRDEEAAAEIAIELPNGIRLRFSSEIAPEYVAALVQRLG
jgi:hypothetical protein